jgi:hypothetical protein
MLKMQMLWELTRWVRRNTRVDFSGERELQLYEELVWGSSLLWMTRSDIKKIFLHKFKKNS